MERSSPGQLVLPHEKRNAFRFSWAFFEKASLMHPLAHLCQGQSRHIFWGQSSKPKTLSPNALHLSNTFKELISGKVRKSWLKEILQEKALGVCDSKPTFKIFTRHAYGGKKGWAAKFFWGGKLLLQIFSAKNRQHNAHHKRHTHVSLDSKMTH